MIFNSHFALEGKHAFLSASKYHWTNYDDEKLANSFRTAQLAQRGTDLHALAAEMIRLGRNAPRNSETFNAYVNDAIGFVMTPEQVLFVSANCFGTVDAISLKPNRRTGRALLRIHDLKTGVNKCSVRQLVIYAAMFCLEYGYKPHELDMVLRLYQNDEVLEWTHESEESQGLSVMEMVTIVMDRILTYDKLIDTLRAEA